MRPFGSRHLRTLPAAVVIGSLFLGACGNNSTATATTTDRNTTTTTTTDINTTAADSPNGIAPPSTVTATTTLAGSAPASTTSFPVAPAPTVSLPPTVPTIDQLLGLQRPIVLAHTAGEDQFPASTLFAFNESVAARVDMLDLNVQLTADGVLVVHHDDTVDRSTNGTGSVASFTYDELAELDDAYWFTPECVCTDKPASDYPYRGMRTDEVEPPPGYAADDFAIPRFRDVVAAFPDMPLNIEVKGNGDPAMAAAIVLASELRELRIEDSVVVTSFDDAVVSAFHELSPDVEISPGLDVSTAWVLAGTPLPDGMRILQLPPEFQGLTVITGKLIDDSHAAGYVVWIWPNNRDFENLDTYRSYLAQGIDGLNINFPEQGVTAVAMLIGAYV